MFDYSEIALQKMNGLAQNILNFLEDRKHRWTRDLSDHRGGRRVASSTVTTNAKRGMTRPLFYSTTGAGSPLDSEFMNHMLVYTSSTIGLPPKQIKGDHINPPQEFGEFFLDKLYGYHTEKDDKILDKDLIVKCLQFTMKKVKIKGSLNNPLSEYTPSTGKTPIVTSQKYNFLNKNISMFKDQLTLYTNRGLATRDELDFLFGNCPIDGYKEWQIEKYDAKCYDYETETKLQVHRNNINSLDNFMS